MEEIEKNFDLDEPTSFLDHENLGCTQRGEFLLEELKNYQDGTNLTQRRFRGLTIWKDMLEHPWNGFANWQTRRQSNFSRSQDLASLIIISRKRNVKQFERCQKYAHKLS